MSKHTTIEPTDNGPLEIRGDFTILLPSGRALAVHGETWLCRCGASQDKPFCDGSHERIGFHATEAEIAPEHLATSPAEDGDAAYVAVAAADAIEEGQLVGAEVDGQPLVVGRVDGQLYAVGGLCSHRGARLEHGELVGEVVYCPLHYGGFNIKTGAAVRLPARTPVPRYEVREENGMVHIARQPSSETPAPVALGSARAAGALRA